MLFSAALIFSPSYTADAASAVANSVCVAALLRIPDVIRVSVRFHVRTVAERFRIVAICSDIAIHIPANLASTARFAASCLSNHRRFHCAGASGRPCPFCQRSFRSSSSLQMHIRWKHRADAAAAVAAAAAAAVAVSGSATSTSSISDAFNHLPGLSYVPTATTINGLSTMSLNGVSSSGQLAGVLSQLVTTSSGSPNKRKWRRKPKPKQNAFGKLDGSTRNILAGINLSEGIDVNAAAAAAGAAAAAVGGPVPLDRKGRPCNFPCPACPRRFAFQCRLAAHLRCHTNVRPFICIDCGRAFTQRGYLVRHAAVHKLDRPFSCELCDRSYKHYGSLVNHRRTHSKLNASTLSNIALLSGTGLDHLGCDGATGTVTGLSSLEEVVGGALHRTDKSDGTDALGVTSTSATTITLLPVTKVEEILPGDVGGSLHQVCLPSVACQPGSTMGSVLSMSDGQQQSQQHLESDQNAQNHPHVPLSHQLTATAVWPILTSGSGGTSGLGTVTQTHPTTGQLIQSSLAQPQSMVSGSHFSTLTISPSQPTTHQLSVASATAQQVNTTAVSSVSSVGTPAFVTVPLFSGQSQPGADTTESSSTTLSNSHSHHHPFHGASALVSTSVATGSDTGQQQQQQSHHQNAPQTTAQHPQTTHQTTSQPPSSDSNTTPVLHVLQPSPSIFFSPYYLPHTAASQM
ncbi:unnamed protein product [Echinostoma caproni]|uniref:Zinc finger protein n=1 Tax=Echinostoma caproni TaxID=27848 RepID=A0A183AP15_9TREM|nr:unnamed protein product [Echinostoma caproni]